ncbi:preprotein translocase subunit SecA [candidate division NPL-UPA2 bacterium]|nr:preprotein translocase subunit SecA [candidate division NPL-UPA2 bacterium]
MSGSILRKVFKTKNERELRRLQTTVDEVNALEPKISKMSDGELRAKTDEFRKRIEENAKDFSGQLETLRKQMEAVGSPEEKQKVKEKVKVCENQILEPVLPEAFAVVREAARRTLGERPYDVQLIGAKVLHEGKIAEMATGEGKTLVATMPLYLNALTGKGCHLVTVNDYLARRDRQWMGPIYEFLGLTVGAIQHDMEPAERRKAYQCDITYGTNNEFGFDYLRDNMVIRKEDRVQGQLHYAIVDEVDSILIDESRTPLIISGPAEEATDIYYTVDKLVRHLKARFVTEAELIDAKNQGISLETGYDYLVDEKHHTVTLTEEGWRKCEKRLNRPHLSEDPSQMEVVHHINQALRAHSLFKRDVDYMVKEGQVLIVDEFTGRLMPGRRWSDGLHQAVEAKEGVRIERENQTLATITFQNYFRLYGKLAGMTGTADTEAAEFHEIYKLDVIVIPPNRTLIRDERPDVIYKTLEEKYEAVVEEIAELHKQGRPVLVGTIHIEKSETLSRMLKRRGIPHHVLNARYHEKEAEIVAQAGRLGAVTIATNMAGRGTDILLGGNPQFLAKTRLRERGLDPDKVSQETFQEVLAEAEKEVALEREKVVQLGGLHILGTERHEARRIDNQLRGRAGRQGDPGSSRFYLSLQDDLMRLFASERISGLMERIGWERGRPLEHRLLSRTIERAQRQVEAHNFDIRKNLLKFDDVMNRQRQVIYEDRRMVLERDELKEEIFRMIGELLEGVEDERGKLKGGIINDYASPDVHQEDWDLKGLEERINRIFPLRLPDKELSSHQQLRELVMNQAREAYEVKEKDIGSSAMREFERSILLHMIDSKWKDHLYAMDHLRVAVHDRAGETAPVVLYNLEGFAMFQDLKRRIEEDTIQSIFRLRPIREGMEGVFLRVPQEFLHPEAGGMRGARLRQPTAEPVRPGLQPESPPEPGAQPAKVTTYRREGKKVGRNEPCPCGSGKKYKKCCGR